MDLKRGHLFVSAEVNHSVEMFDLKSGEHLQSLSGYKTPHSLAFVPEKDECWWAPGILYVFDEDGKQIAQLSIIDVNDDMNFDPIMKRLSISGIQGLNVIHQDTADTYTVMADIPTNGAKTSTYVPSVHQLYVIHPKTSIDGSGLLVFHVNN